MASMNLKSFPMISVIMLYILRNVPENFPKVNLSLLFKESANSGSQSSKRCQKLRLQRRARLEAAGDGVSHLLLDNSAPVATC